MDFLDSLQTDVLVIGAGAAGLMAAISAAEAGAEVLLACKMPEDGLSNSSIMQRSITRAEPEAVDDLFFQVVHAGGFLSDQRLARRFAQEAPERISRLLDYGVRMSAESSEATSDRAGHYVVERVPGERSAYAFTHPLWEKVRDLDVRVLSDTAIADLVVEDERVCGAVAVDLNAIALRPIVAGATVLATGGGAGAFSRNDNAPGTTGDGYALAYRAGAELINMECVAFWYPHERLREILEASDVDGLDPLSLNQDGRCHYFMGGVRIAEDTGTSLAGLFAAGEVAGGLFGAARLGGAAVGEAVVFGSIAGEEAAASACKSVQPTHSVGNLSAIERLCSPGGNGTPDTLKDALGILLWRHAGPFKSANDLEAGKRVLPALRDRLRDLSVADGRACQITLEARNICDLAELVLTSSLRRKESRGNYWRLDHRRPDQQDGLVNILVQQGSAGPEVMMRPVPMTELTEPTAPPIAPGCFGYVQR